MEERRRIEDMQKITPDGWTVFNSMEYKLITTKKSWIVQQQKCRSLGGHLASIPNEETQNFLKDMMLQGGSGCHIGGRYHGTKWQWTDGTVWNYENWAENEPSEGGYDLLSRFVTVEINAPGDWAADGEWNDVGANDIKHAMCQREAGNAGYNTSNSA